VQRARGAIEQLRPETELELTDQDADCRLRQAHAFRRRGEAAEAASPDERLDLAKRWIDEFHL
jgi:hypothetical protein